MKVKSFLNEDFLLENELACRLYHDYAAKLPIIDYHNHLPPELVASDHNFGNITQAWLQGDHYKWRAMRTLGVNEHYITGSANDKEKFLKWAETVPYCLRNPLFHWTHLELQRYFQIYDLLDVETSEVIYDQCNKSLALQSHSTNGLLNMQNVELICTTDDPLDNLEHHIQHLENLNGVKMLPAFRPDKVFMLNAPGFLNYIEKLADVSGHDITNFTELLEALQKRVDYFHEHGSRLCDHGLGQINFVEWSEDEVNTILKKALKGEKVEKVNESKYISAVLYHLSCLYHEKGWVQQFHLGAQRNNNLRLFKTLGPDTGFDSIGDYKQSRGLAAFLSKMDEKDQLAKTIIYNLNPADNEVMAAMAGNFNDGSIRGKIQYGAAWWFLDQKDGMEKQLNALSNIGLLSCFVGMLTDSRSFLSFPRHEYFRRILCNLIGNDVGKGELPHDEKWLGNIVEDVCYHNARNYFGFEKV
jgi:glucuronate isomerase